MENENTIADSFFSKQLTTLDLRARKLRTNNVRVSHSGSDKEKLKRDINTCSALLEQLHDYAFQHSLEISSNQYKLMIEIKADLELLKARIRQQEKSWWHRLQDFSSGA